MTARKPQRTEIATVEVVVNHDDLRRGERGETELTPHVRARLDRGLLRLVVPDDEPDPGIRPLGSTATAGRGSLLGVDMTGWGDDGDPRGTVSAGPGPGQD